MTYLFPRLLKQSWYSRNLCEWHYWLSVAGILVMFIDLTLAGVFQGYYWASLQPWEASIDGSYPFWVVRLFAGLSIIAGQVVFVYNLWQTWLLSRRSVPSYTARALA